jgi:phosphate transport system substrate-binding protein
MNKFKYFFFLFYGCINLLYISCTSNSSNKKSSTPTSGNLYFIAEESIKPVLDSHIFVFEKLYKKASVTVSYLPENKAVELFMKDTCKVIFINRELNKKELSYFKSLKLTPKQTKVGKDGIALIVNKATTDTTLHLQDLEKILTTNGISWKDIHKNSNSTKELKVVFDNTQSANCRYMKDSICKGKAFQKNVFALNNNNQVIEYIKNNDNAIGLISVAWISDLDDPQAQSFLKEVKTIAIGLNQYTYPSDYVKPYQAYLANKEYPLWRYVYAISRESRNGIGTGFVSFVAGEKGQMILLKSGLSPMRVSLRQVEVKNEPN